MLSPLTIGMSITGTKDIASAPRRVLVVDDEPRMASSIKTLLEGAGYDVETAGGGREALKLLAESDFQVVVTDIRMSDIDGLKLIASQGARTNTEFIIITGHPSTESAIEAVQLHAFDYIMKPFDFEVLKASVDRAAAKVERDRFRDDMISMITHDIKIPLSSIIGYSTLVFDKQSGALHPRAREFVQTIRANGIKLLALIDNFLTSFKIEAGRLTFFPREVSLNYVLEDLAMILQVELERNGLHLETRLQPDLPMVMGDENLIFRALSNVLSNATKYTPRGETITLETSALVLEQSPLDGPCVRVRVSNPGPGIPPEDLPHVFEKFRRSRAHRGIEGSGIGSYVLKYIVESHGGKVEVASTPNELTTFSVYLPSSSKSGRSEVVTR